MKLQLALDIVNLDQALRIAEEAESAVDWVEAGTVLIKSEGMDAVRELKKRFPEKKIVADLKAVDAGALEVEIASKAGADIVTIMGVSCDSTIKESIKSARKYNAEIMIDLIGVKEPEKRALALDKLGVDYLCIHTGIDQQMKKVEKFSLLERLAGNVKAKIAIAGGLNSETVVKGLKADVVIIGGAITKSADAGKAAALIKKAIERKKGIKSEKYKKFSEKEVYSVLKKVSTANLADAMHRDGVLRGIEARTPGLKMVGRAFTVRTMRGDWAKPVEAVDRAEPGQVIVIDAEGAEEAVWGDLASNSAKTNGIAGVVIDGAARDIEDIRRIKFPVFSRYLTPKAGEPKGWGEIGGEIMCGGEKIRPGDWIIGDDTGVVVVRKEHAQEIANRAVDVMEKEERLRAEINKGSTLSKVSQLEKWEKR